MVGKRFLAWWAALLALACGYSLLHKPPAPSCLGGLGAGSSFQPNPAVRLLKAQLSSSAGVVEGQRLILTAETNSPDLNSVVTIRFSSVADKTGADFWLQSDADNNRIEIQLRDDGRCGDATAADGKWYGEYIVPWSETATFHACAQLCFISQVGNSAVDFQYVMLPDLQYATKAYSNQNGLGTWN